MRKSLLALLALLIVLPLSALAYYAKKTADDRREIARSQFRALLDDRLRELSGAVAGSIESLERELVVALDSRKTIPAELREVRRKTPLVSQVFLLDREGMLVFPPHDATRSEQESEFLRRTAAIWTGQAILYAHPTEEDASSTPSGDASHGDSLIDLASRAPRGWIAWHWREGLHFIFWKKLDDGRVIGAEVERIVLLSRIVASLPSSTIEEGRVVLADSRGDALYQWGAFDPEGAAAAAQLALAHPLDSWSFEYYASPAQRAAFLEAGGGLPWFYGLFGPAVALILLALGLHRGLSRDLREAAQRVSFVTQVSHELKTPLANIRLYAELLQAEVEEEGKAAERLSVIVSESERLTRLIENILTFAKHRRGQLLLEPKPFLLDQLVDRVLAHFSPAFSTKKIEASFERGAERSVLADPDAVEQILANLLSNVEKYAASGGKVEVLTEEDDQSARLIVSDRGPGVPLEHRALIFEPFHRVSDRLNDGVAGTGIGLTIARELARSSGGDLSLSDTERGARFVLTLPLSPPDVRTSEREREHEGSDRRR